MKVFFMIGCVLAVTHTFCQDTLEVKKAWTMSGYLKEMAWVRSDNNFNDASTTILVHNRLNVKYNPSQTWSGRMEIRNRFYWGDDVRQIAGFREQLRNKGEAVNLSVKWYDVKSVVLHSNVERLWLEYRKPKWNIRMGRQRVNWGICDTWNPNDLFNTYNFLDFDYEERPGVDAVKTQYIINDLSNIEAVFARTGGKSIVAAKYFTNFRKYDLQANAGWYGNTVATGFGWAGSVADAGFKGEVQYYADKARDFSNLLFTVEGNYMFKSGWYAFAGFLYNQKGLDGPLVNPSKLTFQASPRNLMPTRWNVLLTSMKEFSPLVSGSLSIVYAPGTNLLILFPSVKYNLNENWDIDFVWQSFFAETTVFENLSHTAYLRLKWSF